MILDSYPFQRRRETQGAGGRKGVISSLVRANIPRRVEKKTVRAPPGMEETATGGDSLMKNLREGMGG